MSLHNSQQIRDFLQTEKAIFEQLNEMLKDKIQKGYRLGRFGIDDDGLYAVIEANYVYDENYYIIQLSDEEIDKFVGRLQK